MIISQNKAAFKIRQQLTFCQIYNYASILPKKHTRNQPQISLSRFPYKWAEKLQISFIELDITETQLPSQFGCRFFFPSTKSMVSTKNNRKPTTDCENMYGLDPLITIDHTYREYNHLLTVSNFARKKEKLEYWHALSMLLWVQNKIQLCREKMWNTFKVHEDTVFASPGFALADNDSRHDFLSEVRLALLHCGHDHVSHSGGRKPVQPPLHSLHWDDVQVLRSCVVGTVDNRSYWESQWHPELVSCRSSSPCHP